MSVKKLPAHRPPAGLTQRDGWNFGLGFFLAAFVFTFILIPAVFCLVSLLLMFFGSALQGLN